MTVAAPTLPQKSTIVRLFAAPPQVRALFRLLEHTAPALGARWDGYKLTSWQGSARRPFASMSEAHRHHPDVMDSMVVRPCGRRSGV